MESVLRVQVDSLVDLEKSRSIEQLSSMTIVCLGEAEKLQVHIEVASCGEELQMQGLDGRQLLHYIPQTPITGSLSIAFDACGGLALR